MYLCASTVNILISFGAGSVIGFILGAVTISYIIGVYADHIYGTVRTLPTIDFLEESPGWDKIKCSQEEAEILETAGLSDFIPDDYERNFMSAGLEKDDGTV